MNEALAYVVAQRMERTAAALRKNNMAAYCVKTADEVVPLVKTLLAEGATVGAGGSMTLEECGVMDLLRSGAYHFLDRGAPGLTPEDIGKIYRQIFSADCYFASANAVTEDGLMVQIDGTGNRVGAMCYGPGTVYVLIGRNKIVSGGYAQAVKRIKEIACPQNARRQHLHSPCAETGHCNPARCEESMCRVTVAFDHAPGGKRTQVVLINEDLGY